MNFKKFIHFKDRTGSVIGLVLELITNSGDLVIIQPYSWQSDEGNWTRLNENEKLNRLTIDLRRVTEIKYFDDYETFITEYFAELL